jgi:hypothetical protein
VGFFLGFVLFWDFESGFHSVAQADFQLMIILPKLLKC